MTTPNPLQEAAIDRLELDNLHTLNTVLAINRDMQLTDQIAKDRIKRNNRQVDNLTCHKPEPDEMPEDDAVKWKTTENHYHPAPPAQKSGLGWPAALALAGTLGPLGIGGAIVGKALIDKLGAPTQPAEVDDQQIDVWFDGGRPTKEGE